MDDVDALGVVRQHRRFMVAAQEAYLKADGCRVIVRLDGHKRVPRSISRDDMLRLIRPGTVVKLVHTFLLGDPKAAKRIGGKRKDLLDAMAQIEKRGGTVKDVDSGLTTANTEHRYALVALACDQLARDGKGVKSRANGLVRKGRPVRTWTPEQWAQAKSVWESRKLKKWSDVKEMLPEGMSLWRAYRAFGARDV